MKITKKYFCAACGANVEKYKNCGMVAAKGKEKVDYAGLGGWRCTGSCKSSIKVKVELIQQ
jgi:hypothetical protein